MSFPVKAKYLRAKARLEITVSVHDLSLGGVAGHPVRRHLTQDAIWVETSFGLTLET